jgi:hypothetical protein
MAIYCSKKICVHNSACCSYYNEKKEFPVCTLEDIMIDDQVECCNFKFQFDKIDICKKCSIKKGVISFNLHDDIKVNIKEAEDFNPNNF